MDEVLTDEFSLLSVSVLRLMYRYITFLRGWCIGTWKTMYRYMRIFWLTSSSAPFFLDVSVHAGNVPVHTELFFMYRACIGRTGVRQGFGVTCTGTCKTCTDTYQIRKLQNLLWWLKSPPELTYRLIFVPARLEYLLYLLLQFLWSFEEHFTSFHLKITSSFQTTKSEE